MSEHDVALIEKTIELHAKLIRCPEHDRRSRRSHRACKTCNGKGYIIIDRSKKAVVPVECKPHVMSQSDKNRITTAADRIEAGLCPRCGEEPLVSKTLGARCLELANEKQKRYSDRKNGRDAEIG